MPARIVAVLVAARAEHAVAVGIKGVIYVGMLAQPAVSAGRAVVLHIPACERR
jgi:hypothetical protein